VTMLPIISRRDERWILTWQAESLVMYVELCDDSRVEWFYRDRATDFVAGTDDAEPHVKVFADEMFRASMQAIADAYDAETEAPRLRAKPAVPGASES
jgi:hypothetical protein